MKTICLTLGAAILSFGSYVEAGPLVPNNTVDISFVGHCDGMHLVINQNTGKVTGNSIGCVSDPLIGSVGSLSGLGEGISVMNRTFFFVIDNNPRNWTLFTSNGALLQSGTYNIAAPAALNTESGPETGSP